MDKFVVRTPRKLNSVSSTAERSRQLTQTTIEALPGVVVIEDIKRVRSVLRIKDQKKEILLQSLEELDKKIPSRDVLKSTKIGHTVNRLTKDPDSDVAEKARSLIKKWKVYFKAKLDRPLLEVRSDRKTEELRNAARKHLAASLQCHVNDALVKLIEQEAYHQHRRLVSAPYRRTVRKIVFTLKHQPDVRLKVNSKALAVSELVNQCKRDSKVS